LTLINQDDAIDAPPFPLKGAMFWMSFILQQCPVCQTGLEVATVWILNIPKGSCVGILVSCLWCY
jgi:hypothetical protein